MKYTLYKDDKFIMRRKHFYPIKMYLIKTLGIKNILVLLTISATCLYLGKAFDRKTWE